jgi:hypothetical protein
MIGVIPFLGFSAVGRSPDKREAHINSCFRIQAAVRLEKPLRLEDLVCIEKPLRLEEAPCS